MFVGGCVENDIDIVITSTPLAFSSNTGPYCEGDPILIFGNTNSSGTIIEYNWTGPNNYTSTDQNPSDATEGGMYILQVIVDGCPSNFEATEVVVTDTPSAIALNSGPYCLGSSIQLFGSTVNIGSTSNFVTNKDLVQQYLVGSRAALTLPHALSKRRRYPVIEAVTDCPVLIRPSFA